MNQLGLFGPTTEVAPHVTEEDRVIAARIPARIRFGTSSWSFPGWAGIVYEGSPSEQTLARAGLAAYARHPLFRTVGLDRSHYAPLRDDDLRAYAAQLEGTEEKRFAVVSKVWNEITTSSSPRFLDASVFLSEVLAPYERAFTEWAGPFVFQLAPMPRHATTDVDLARKLDAFLSHLPHDGRFRYAFELRNAELLGARWLDTLRAHGAAHVFNYWTAMPSLRAQLAAGKHVADFMVVRLMLPPFARYESKKQEFAPFNRLVARQPEMREDVRHVLRAAEEAGCEDAFVLVNNKAEGSSPLTVRELAREISGEHPPDR